MFILLLFVLFPYLYSNTNFALVSPGDEVKPVQLFDGQGKMTNLIDLARGERPVVLSIFTIACAPCKLEIFSI